MHDRGLASFGYSGGIVHPVTGSADKAEMLPEQEVLPHWTGEEWLVPDGVIIDRPPQGLNPYTMDLVALQRFAPVQEVKLRAEIATVRPSLLLWEWEKGLASHPDVQFKEVIQGGICDGFHIGYNYKGCPHHSAKQNMRSALDNQEVIESYLAQECLKQRLVGPLTHDGIPGLQISPFGVIPKRQPSKWQLITNLSAPETHSVNDGISKFLCSLKYISVDDILRKIVRMGRGALLAKADLKEVYRMVPVHPHDRPLLGMEWQD